MHPGQLSLFPEGRPVPASAPPEVPSPSRRKDPMAARGQPKRSGPDFWPTPECLIAAASEYVLPSLPPSPIWECAAGDHRLARALGATIATDKFPQDGTVALDFLTDPPPAAGLVAFTNPPYHSSAKFIQRGLQLLDTGALDGLVLLLRHDHFMAGGKVEALNRAILEVHCNWRPRWIPETVGNPRWAFAWVYWGEGKRQPPLYVRGGARWNSRSHTSSR
jgi:hypothetical protein